MNKPFIHADSPVDPWMCVEFIVVCMFRQLKSIAYQKSLIHYGANSQLKRLILISVTLLHEDPNHTQKTIHFFSRGEGAAHAHNKYATPPPEPLNMVKGLRFFRPRGMHGGKDARGQEKEEVVGDRVGDFPHHLSM
jgi:hypothetical protein